MDQSNIDESNEFHWTKGLIFTAIVLFPLIPFVLIYRHKFSRKTKIILMVIYFIFLTGVYQFACMAQGEPIHTVRTADRYVYLKAGDTYQINFTTDPGKKDLHITKVEYLPGNSSIVSVNNQGLVTSLTPGKTKINIKVSDNHYTTKEKAINFVVIE